jgi:Fe-S-cluster containining protein
MKRTGNCTMCAECCRAIRLTTVLSETVSQHGSLDEARLYYSYRGITVAGIDEQKDRICLEMDIACSKLTKDGGCAVHDRPELKPVLCHRYPLEPDDIETCGYIFTR